MTIFAWDGEHLVSDKAEFKYGIVVNDKACKLLTFEHNGITCSIAGAGSTIDILALRKFILSAVRSYIGKVDIMNFEIQNPQQYMEMVSTFDEYDSLVVFYDRKEKTACGYHFGKQPIPLKVTPPYAGGHQDAVIAAIAAMKAGADAVKATQIAVELTCISQTMKDLDVVITG